MLVNARTVAVYVGGVQNGAVFCRHEIPGLAHPHMDLSESLCGVHSEVPGKPAGALAEPEEPKHLALSLVAGQGVYIPRAPPLPERVQVEFRKEPDSLFGAETS